jgi:hypothetical protein
LYTTLLTICKPVFSHFFRHLTLKKVARNLPDWSVNDDSVRQARGFATDGVFTGHARQANKIVEFIVYNFS